MYLECVSCPKIGVSCDGPNFVALSAQQLLDWCNQRKAFLRMSNAKLAELSGMPKGTIDRLLAGRHESGGFHYETIRPLVKVLVGGEWSGDPCPDPPDTEKAEMAEKLRHHDDDLKWRDDRIQHLLSEISVLEQQLTTKDEQLKERAGFLHRKDRAIGFLSLALAVVLVAALCVLVIDISDPTIGFFRFQ